MVTLPPDAPPPHAAAEDEPGFWSPDPDEPPAIELGKAVGDLPPFGTVLVLLACGIVFAAQAVRREVGDSAALIAWGASLRGATGIEAWWRPLASTLIHGGGLHLLLNGISLLIYGGAAEAIFARSAFWVIWVIGGVAAAEGSLAWRIWRGAPAGISVGASGAIFALAGAIIASAIRLRGRLATGRARALAGASIFLVAQSLSAGVLEHGTDNAAHGAGLVAGLLLGLVLPLQPRITGRPAGAAGLLAGVLAGAALAATFAYSLMRGLERP